MATINFAGYNWTIKTSVLPVGPGPNYFSDRCVSIIDNELVFEVINEDPILCGELILTESLGYGRYIFQMSSRIDIFANNLVLGLFTWTTNNSIPNNSEIDIEFSRWNGETLTNSQYVVQPPSVDSLHRFTTILDGSHEVTTHIIDWKPTEIKFTSINGCYLSPPSVDATIQTWTYSGNLIPVPSNECIHINLWKYGGGVLDIDPGQVLTVAIKDFQFFPYFY